MNYLPSRNITVIMHFTVLLALKNNVTVELITKSVIILNLAVWSYRPLSIFSYANDDSDSKCVFSHKKQKVTTHLFWKATTLQTTKSCRNYLGKKAPHDYRRLNLHENLTGFFLSAAEQ